jgi:hypothetical protein
MNINNSAAVTILAVFICLIQTSHSAHKLRYVIGGSSTDVSSIFIDKYRLLFETYLNDSVGSSFDPPITFSLVPVDYFPEQTSRAMFLRGELDFLCEQPQPECLLAHSLPTHCTIIQSDFMQDPVSDHSFET